VPQWRANPGLRSWIAALRFHFVQPPATLASAGHSSANLYGLAHV
jgi:hypothetical protein